MHKPLVLLGLLLFISLSCCSEPGTDLPSKTAINQISNTTAQSVLPTTYPANHTLTVFAAASLTGVFQEIGKDFEAANPGVKVSFNFAGSQILRTQLEQGALADVFASADHKNMDMLVIENLVAANTYQDFVTNKLIVILPAGNPGNVQSIGDLAKSNLKLVLADESVPAGNYARQILTKISDDPAYGSDFNAKVLANIVSNETDVKQVVTKVELGEADAGIVYISDVVAAPDLATITIPDNFNVTANYPIAILTNAPQPKLAEAFIAYIISPAGQATFSKWDFIPMEH